MSECASPKHTSAPLSYLQHVPPDEKPYHMMYGDDTSLPRTNMARRLIETAIHDIRGNQDALLFPSTGLAVAEIRSAMTYLDFFDDAKVWTIYLPELRSLLLSVLDAQEVSFFRYGLRQRHPQFPISSGKIEEYVYAQPTVSAHVDATLDTTKEQIEKDFGARAADILDGRRFQWVNVWKPLRADGSPTNDWPLCFCDASTVSEADGEATDMVYADYYTENLTYRFNPDQRWYYLPDHRPEEVVIFKQSDSDPTAVPGVPHCSFPNPLASPGESPRESIEARALVIY